MAIRPTGLICQVGMSPGRNRQGSCKVRPERHIFRARFLYAVEPLWNLQVLGSDLLQRHVPPDQSSPPSQLKRPDPDPASLLPSSPSPQRMQRPQTQPTNFTSHHRACAFHLLAFGSLLSIGSSSSIDQSINQSNQIKQPSTLSHDRQTWLLTRVLTARRVTTRPSLPHPQALTTPSAAPQLSLALPRRTPSPPPGLTSPASPTSRLLMSGLILPPPSRLTSALWPQPQAQLSHPHRASHPRQSTPTSCSPTSCPRTRLPAATSAHQRTLLTPQSSVHHRLSCQRHVDAPPFRRVARPPHLPATP